MRQTLFLAALAASLLAGQARAQSCSATQYPYPLTNGSAADAGQVTADLNCAGVYGLAHWTGNVGIGNTSPGNPLTISTSAFAGGNILSLNNNNTTGAEASIVYNSSGVSSWVAGNGAWGNAGKFIIGSGGALVAVQANGNVGIGTTSPASRLVVTTASAQSVDGVTIYGPDQHNIAVRPSNGAGNANGIVQAGDAAIVFTNNAVNTGALDLAAWADGATGMRITAAGVVSVDTASPPGGYAFYVNGAAAGSSGFATTSDARLKTNVTPVTGALATVARLQGVHYHWLPAGERPVGKALNLPVDQPQIGFLAQAVQKVVPEAVTAPKTADDIYTLDPSKLIPVLVEAIKEQQAEIGADRASIAELKAKVAKLEAAR